MDSPPPPEGGAGGAWLCSLEEMRRSSAGQIGASACGPTALLNVLRGVGYGPLPTAEDALLAAPPRMRDYSSRSLRGYLVSRATAGTIHTDLIDGAERLSGGEVTGRFFAVDQFASPEGLSEWLRRWIRLGAVPLLTLNLFLRGQDAFHHQTVFGVEGGGGTAGGVWVSNPVMKYSPSHLLPLLTQGQHMVIPRAQIEGRFKEAIADGSLQEFLSEMDVLDSEEPWSRFAVGSQVMRMLARLRQQDNKTEVDVRQRPFSDLVIPWGGLAGITVFASRRTGAMEELQKASALGLASVTLPLYGTSTRIPVVLGQRQLCAPEAPRMEVKAPTEDSSASYMGGMTDFERVQRDYDNAASAAEKLAIMAGNPQHFRPRPRSAVSRSLDFSSAGGSKATGAEGFWMEDRKDRLLPAAASEAQRLREELVERDRDLAALAADMAALVKEYKVQAGAADQAQGLANEIARLRVAQLAERKQALAEKEVLLAEMAALRQQLREAQGSGGARGSEDLGGAAEEPLADPAR